MPIAPGALLPFPREMPEPLTMAAVHYEKLSSFLLVRQDVIHMRPQLPSYPLLGSHPF